MITYNEKSVKNSIVIFSDDTELLEKATVIQPFHKKIVASKENKNFLLDLNCILYFCYENNEINIVTNESIYHVNHSLQFWQERLLHENFIRCQKGYLVNIEKIIEIIPYFNSTLGLRLKGYKNIIPVGRSFLKSFKDALWW